MKLQPTSESPVICWWSGGVTSAIACKIAMDIYGKNNCRVIFIDTYNEHEDTYRFKDDCENWYGKRIESISAIPKKYKSIQEVWISHKSLNVANGAICSSVLKRDVRLKFQREEKYSYQVFGYDIGEPRRAVNMAMNHPKANPIFPLLLYGFSKEDCIKEIQENGIQIPIAYYLGLLNNNCLKTGCVQGGVGYWQHIRDNPNDFPGIFDNMAEIEHKLTNLKGKPVTMLRDNSNAGIKSGKNLVFLKPHPKYPEYKHIGQMKGRKPKPLVECNGFCGINDGVPSSTYDEINREGEDQLKLF